jgi:CO/xanthine dehydrogenase Mo-binding subunit
LDIRNIRTAFESSYQPDGPFGAKSIGEMVINTPCPAINDAIYNATGHYLNEVPFTPSNVYLNAILPSLQDEAK